MIKNENENKTKINKHKPMRASESPGPCSGRRGAGLAGLHHGGLVPREVLRQRHHGAEHVHQVRALVSRPVLRDVERAVQQAAVRHERARNGHGGRAEPQQLRRVVRLRLPAGSERVWDYKHE